MSFGALLTVPEQAAGFRKSVFLRKLLFSVFRVRNGFTVSMEDDFSVLGPRAGFLKSEAPSQFHVLFSNEARHSILEGKDYKYLHRVFLFTAEYVDRKTES